MKAPWRRPALCQRARAWCFTLLVVFCGTVSAGGQESPNVILIMSDDQGWGDVSYRGHDRLKTPHLDSLAADGIRLDRFYSAAPVCSPTRGSMLTGRHPYRYGIFSANVGHLPAGEITIAELLAEQGYIAGHFGKWHLGTLTTTIAESNRGGPRGKKHYCLPSANGFSEWFSTEAKTPTWDPMWKPKESGGRKWWVQLTGMGDRTPYGTNYWHNGQRATSGLEGDDSRVIMDRAIPFIEHAAAQEKPFLAVIWFHAPHLPVVGGRKYTEPFADLDPFVQQYYGCLAAMDEQIGRLRTRLKSLDVDQDTLIWFCADNGPEGNEKSPGSTGGLRGRKRSLYEGGIRVPGIVCWPSNITPGSRSLVPASTSDCLPTIAAIVGSEAAAERPLDGIDIGGVLDGTLKHRPTPIGFESAGKLAWVDNQFKLVATGMKNGTIGNVELYDLAKDSAETRNIAAMHPDRAARMKRDLKAWRESCRRSLEEYGPSM